MTEKLYRDLTVQADVESEIGEILDDLHDIREANSELKNQVRKLKRMVYMLLLPAAIVFAFVASSMDWGIVINTANIDQIYSNQALFDAEIGNLYESMYDLVGASNEALYESMYNVGTAEHTDQVNYEEHLIELLNQCQKNAAVH